MTEHPTTMFNWPMVPTNRTTFFQMQEIYEEPILESIGELDYDVEIASRNNNDGDVIGKCIQQHMIGLASNAGIQKP